MLLPPSIMLPIAAVVAAGGATALALHSDPKTSAPHVARPQARADAVARQGRAQYRAEVSGRVERTTAHHAATNPALLAALSAGNASRAKAIATSLLYHRDHISHIEIVRGGRSVVSVGKAFVSGASPVRLRGNAGTMYVSIQDVIGFVRLLHRRTGADVVVRGRGGHVASSLRATSLPSRGPTTVAGRRYHVTSFAETGLLGEPLRIWVLVRG